MGDVSLEDRIQALDKHVKELQRRVFFCVNNYSGGSHPQNENELLKHNFEIIQNAQKDGKCFLEKIQQMGNLILQAEKRSDEVDQELIKYGLLSHANDTDCDENKENTSEDNLST